MGKDYAQAGVNVKAGYESVELIKPFVSKTFSKDVLTGLGGFGALFSIAKAKDMQEPVLVSGTDGVGTKLKIAFLMDKHDTVGIDCVAMCVNDVICCGAEPLFFLDYIACGKNQPQKISEIVKGMADGCLMAGVSLVGGETAEMPGFYDPGEYDLAGFTVGILDKSKIIDGSKIIEGDVVIGLASSGLHSNGFSLVRNVLRPNEVNVNELIQSFSATLGDELIKPTRIYVKPILELIRNVEIKGIANITGGGFIENIPRVLPDGLCAKINRGSWPVLPVFNYLQQAGDIAENDMYNTFNMGIGMVVVTSKDNATKAVAELERLGEKTYIIGEIIKGNGIELC